MRIPSTLFTLIVDAAGRHMAKAAVAQTPTVMPIHPEDAVKALREEAQAALKALDIEDMLREEVQAVVERDIDVDRAFDEARDDIESDLRRAAEDIDLEELSKEAVADAIAIAMPDDEIRAGFAPAIAVAVDTVRHEVIEAAGAALATAVVNAAGDDAAMAAIGGARAAETAVGQV